MSLGWVRRGTVVWVTAGLLCLTTSAKAETQVVRFDPRIELFSILFHLAGAPEYSGKIESHVAAVDRHFERFKRHPAVATTARIRKEFGVGYFHPMNLAVHLTNPPELAERTPFDGSGHALGKRWPAPQTRSYLDEVRAFYREARVGEFIKSQASLYQLGETRLRDLLAHEGDIPWFDRFFGGRSATVFVVVPALLNGGAQYGATYRDGHGAEEAHAVIGVYKLDETGLPRFDHDDAINIVHEFTHTLTNSEVAAHLVGLEVEGPRLFKAVKGQMRDQGYGEWQTMIQEAIVRAVVVRFIDAHQGQEAASAEVQAQGKLGFTTIAALAEALSEYEASRARYPKFGDFMPRLIAVLKGESRIPS